jgi:hypothetical protein
MEQQPADGAFRRLIGSATHSDHPSAALAQLGVNPHPRLAAELIEAEEDIAVLARPCDQAGVVPLLVEALVVDGSDDPAERAAGEPPRR